MPTTMMKLLDYDPKTGGRLSQSSSLERAAVLRSLSNGQLIDLVGAAALVLVERHVSKIETEGVFVRITGK